LRDIFTDCISLKFDNIKSNDVRILREFQKYRFC